MKKQFVHKIIKNSRYSYVVTIPREIMNKFGWTEKQRLSIKMERGKKMVVKDYKKR